jgi:hypothetical protein
MLLLIDIFSINKGRGYENPSLEIIVTECCSFGGCPLEEACEHCFLNQSVVFDVVLISFLCYCGDYVGYITVILPFLAFYFCSAYLLYLVSCRNHCPSEISTHFLNMKESVQSGLFFNHKDKCFNNIFKCSLLTWRVFPFS